MTDTCGNILEWYDPMWAIYQETEYSKRVKKWPKKHHLELIAVHDNLDTFQKALNRGAKLEQIRFGFIHPEPKGILAIDQKGGGVGLKQTRLYIYPNKETQIIHLLTLGDKGSQTADIKFASMFVDNLRREGENHHG